MQKLNFRITENGITRDATPGEIVSWYLIKCDEACADVGDCTICPLLDFDNRDGCITNIRGAEKHMKGKEIIIITEEK